MCDAKRGTPLSFSQIEAVAAGRTSLAIRPSTRFTIGRLLSNGSPDNRFDSDGKLTSPDLTPLPTEYATGVQIQPGGKIVVSGTALSSSGIGNFLLARYLPNGPIDTTFGPFGSGIVHDDWGGDDRAPEREGPPHRLAPLGGALQRDAVEGMDGQPDHLGGKQAEQQHQEGAPGDRGGPEPHPAPHPAPHPRSTGAAST